MAKVPVTVVDSPTAAAAGMPPPVDSDSDSDHYSLHEPQFVIHAVDDYRRPPAPAPAPAVLFPFQQDRPALAFTATARADMVERLGYSLILPQGVLCCLNVALGVVMICVANNTEAQINLVGVVVPSALIMLFSLLSMLLSILGVYYYDG
ncbi:unnamed protein product [Urochloa humidicola]